MSLSPPPLFPCPLCSLSHSFLFYRSSDGLTLYAVSSDGTLACFAFDCNELEGIAPQGTQKEYLRKFEFVPPPLPNGYVHVPPAQPVPIKVEGRVNGDQGYTPPSTPPGDRSQSQGRDGFGSRGASLGAGSVNGNGAEQVTTLVARRAPKDRNRRRTQPTFVGSLGSESARGKGSVPPASVGGALPMKSSTGSKDRWSSECIDGHGQSDGRGKGE